VDMAKHKGHYRLGTLAHELGHASGKTALPGLYALGKLSPLGGLLASLSTDKDTAAIGAAGSTALAAPMLAEELRASLRGSRALKSMGKSRSGAFAGLATYGAFSALPGLMYAVRKRQGTFDPKAQAGRKEYADASLKYLNQKA